MKKKDLTKAVVLSMALGMGSGMLLPNFASAADATANPILTRSEDVKFDNNTFISLNYYEKGTYKSDDNVVNLRTITDTEKAALYKGLEYWYNVLGTPKAGTPTIAFYPMNVDGDNAAASSEANGSVTNLAKYFIDSSFEGVEGEAGLIEIQNGKGNWYYDKLPVIPINGTKSDYAGTIVHEMFHALGITSTVEAKADTTNTISVDSLTTYDLGLRDINGKALKDCTSIKLISNVSEANKTDKVFYILNDTNGGVYYTGKNVQDVLNGATLSWPDDSTLAAVPGIPINCCEENATELSHFELQSSLQSHQMYRSWCVPMEAELAVMQDMGYTIDRKKFFGYSIYNSGTADNLNSVTNTAGYDQSQSWGVGLHVYGSYNKVTQNANIKASGAEALGIRVDGTGNDITIASGIAVAANGTDGRAINFTYGNGQSLTVESNSTVSATGSNGRALSFDFGDNEMGNNIEYRGSYIWTKENTNQSSLLSALNGPLMNTVNINGNIVADSDNGGTAIYISPNALVKEINVNSGATITGNIVDDWDKTASFVQLPTSEDGMTSLNFGDIADFNMSYAGNINATNGMATTLNVNVNNGNLTYTGTANVNSVTVASGATLTGGTYSVNTFTNNGTIAAIKPVDSNTYMTINTTNKNGYSGNGKILATANGQYKGIISIDSTPAKAKLMLLAANNNNNEPTNITV